DRHFRLQLPRVEGQLLSCELAAIQDACVLRFAVSNRRDQLHLLSNAHREARWRMGGRHSVAVQTDAQGAAADYARQSPEKLRSASDGLLRGRWLSRREAWRAPFSAPAHCKEGSGPARCLSERSSAESPRRVRIPSRVMARR